MLEKRTFIINAYNQTPDEITVTGIAERYDTQLQWEAIKYSSEEEWIVQIPRQKDTAHDTKTAYELVFEGYTDFKTDVKNHLNTIPWEKSPSPPFEVNATL